MAKVRVFELARELGVTSKVILQKCHAEDVDIKGHMSTVSAGLEETIREWFSEAQGEHTAVETAEHVDLAKARAEAKKQRRRSRKKKPEPEQAPPPDQQPEGAEEPAAEQAGEPAAPADAAEAPAETATAVAEAPAEPDGVAVEAEAVVGDQPPADEDEVAADDSEPVEVAQEPAEPDEPEQEPVDDEPVAPAGPQVVPKQAVLKGPRVVRVERPEAVERPRPRRRPAAAPMGQGARIPATTDLRKERDKQQTDDDGRGKKRKRRSPRRRSDRTGAPATPTAKPTEPTKEWRDVDLVERSQRLAAAGGGLRRHRANVSRAGGGPGSNIHSGPVEIAEPITVKSLSEATGIKTTELLKKMMEAGVLATVNHAIATELAETIVADHDIELIVRAARTAADDLADQMASRDVGELTTRAPVVTFLGHVDHGKTSLLDHIRQSSVATGEAGGITQHIGAYRYDQGDRHVVFLDTPGHEAFTAMRARGANMTDVVVLVVAADDGVMPQTAEAISHAKAAEVTIVVALNKVDLPNANVQRVLGQLAEHDVTVSQWGGNVELVETSATTGQGIDDLVELLSLEAEILELKAEVDAPATGFVIESKIDQGRGVIARVLVRNGTLNLGDVLLAGKGYGRVRMMTDSRGQAVTEAGPSTPVEVAGLDEVPEAGDKFYVVDTLDLARDVAEDRRRVDRRKLLTPAAPVTLDTLFTQIEAGDVQEVPLIIKADVQGSIEALTGSLDKLSTDEVKLNIMHTGVGGISTGDITLAEASGALVIGFNVVADSASRAMADEKGVDIRLYRVIYDIIDDMRRVMSEGLAPDIHEESLGRAEIRRTFKISRLGTIAGCYVTEGRLPRNAKVRIIRDSVVVEDNRTLESLKHEKDDIREARAGTECGIKVAGYDDLKEGDILEFYQHTEVARSL